MLSQSEPTTVADQVPAPIPPKGKRSKQWRWFLRLAGTGLLVFFLWRLNLDLGKIGAQLAAANLWLVGLAVLGAFPLNALKGWRWQLILKDLRIRISFNQAYRLYALGTSAGSFTPGQAGDLIKAWYLNNMGFKLGTGIISVVLDRLFDVAALMLMATSGLLVLGSNFVNLLPALLVLLVGTLAGLTVLSVPGLRDRLLDPVIRLILRRRGGLDQSEADEQVGPVNFGPVFALTVLATLVVLGRVWLLALSLGIQLEFMQIVAASSLATVISLVPVSVGGIGARDFILIYVLDRLGYDREKAVSLSTFILLLQLVNLLIGYAIWRTGKEVLTTPQPILPHPANK